MEDFKDEKVSDTEPIQATIEDVEVKEDITDTDEKLEKPKPTKKPRTEKQIQAFEKAKLALKKKREAEKQRKLASKKPRGRPPKKIPDMNNKMDHPIEQSDHITKKRKPKSTKYIINESDSSSEDEQIIVVKKKDRKRRKKKRKPKVVYVSQSSDSESSDSDYDPAGAQEVATDKGYSGGSDGTTDVFGGMHFV